MDADKASMMVLTVVAADKDMVVYNLVVPPFFRLSSTLPLLSNYKEIQEKL